MKKIKIILKVAILSILMAFAVSADAQTPTYSCVVQNEVMVSPTVYQFDIYLNQTGSVPFYLLTYQFCFNITNISAILNGGTLTSFYIPGSTQLIPSLAPNSIVNVNFTGNNLLLKVNGPMPSLCGDTIPSTQIRVGTFQITNTADFLSQPVLSWWNAVPATTLIYAMDPANACGSNTNITNMAFHYINPIVISFSTTNNICSGDCTGAADITVTGGKPPYTYLWSNGAITQDIVNLCVGNYTVIVTDSSSCSVNSTLTITATNAFTVTTSYQDAHCNQSDGSAMVNVSGGSGAYSYLWNNGQTTNSITNVSSGVYSVSISDGICTEVYNITVGNISGPVTSISGTVSAICGSPAGSVNANVSGGAPPYSYLWNSIPPQYTKDLANVAPGNYCLSVTDTNNCMAVVCATITANIFPQPDICIVSVDTAVNQNLVVWEKPANTGGIDQYLIYKESSFAGVYNLIGSQSVSVISTFLDAASNPAQQANRYKIAIADTCGNISSQSSFHETIHLTANVGINNEVNLIWNHYIGFTFGTYNIYRGSSLSTLTLLASISSSNSSYTDLTPPSGNQYYLIEALRPVACSPSKGISSTRSNILQLTITDIPESSISKDIRIFPNPASTAISVESGVMNKKGQCRIYNAFGTLIAVKSFTGNKFSIDVSNLAKGLYLLKVESENGVAVKRFVKE